MSQTTSRTSGAPTTSPTVDAPTEEYSLLLVDADPIFRMGMRALVVQFPEFAALLEAESTARAWSLLRERSQPDDAASPVDLIVNLIILDAAIADSLSFCQQVRQQSPDLPILILTALGDRALLETFREMGVRSYCPKGIASEDLVRTIKGAIAGESYWETLSALPIPSTSPSPSTPTPPRRANPTVLLGLHQVNATLDRVRQQIQQPGYSVLDRIVLRGRQRELLTVRWFLRRMVPPNASPSVAPTAPSDRPTTNNPLPANPSPTSSNSQEAALVATSTPLETLRLAALQPGDWRGALFRTLKTKIQSGLANTTNTPLELDILRADKKQELLLVLVQTLEALLADLMLSHVPPHHLAEKRITLLQDLWREALTEFFGKYLTVPARSVPSDLVRQDEMASVRDMGSDREIEITPVLLEEAEAIRIFVLDRIPLVNDLFAHLIYETPLQVDGKPCYPGSPQAMQRAEMLLQNTAIALANAIVQPLLNTFSDVEAIKQMFFARNLLSTRDIDRFRNNLNWRDRVEIILREPTAIYECQHHLWVLDERGITQTAIYTPRRNEYEELTTLQRSVMFSLEVRDAIAPRLRAAVAFLGNGLIYVLTQVIGRGIGLIGRGILQGIGSSWQDIRWRNHEDR